MKVIIADKVYKSDHKLGTYMEDTDYDLLVEEDMDFYAPIQELGRTEPSEEECIFKFRKNRFTREEQLGAYEGLVNAALPTQNRGLAAGPKGERQGGRNWCTEEQIEIMEYFMTGTKASLFEEDGDPIENIKKRHAEAKDPSEARGIVWIKSKIEEEGYDYEKFFDIKVEEILRLPIQDQGPAAKNLFEEYVSNTTYANQVLSGIAG